MIQYRCYTPYGYAKQVMYNDVDVKCAQVCTCIYIYTCYMIVMMHIRQYIHIVQHVFEPVCVIIHMLHLNTYSYIQLCSMMCLSEYNIAYIKLYQTYYIHTTICHNERKHIHDTIHRNIHLVICTSFILVYTARCKIAIARTQHVIDIKLYNDAINTMTTHNI